VIEEGNVGRDFASRQSG